MNAWGTPGMKTASRWLPVGAITLAFAAAASIGIGDSSFWLDEAESWMWATVPLSELVQAAGESNHGPTYYAALHAWSKLGLDSDAWLRALSLVFMALTVPVVYMLGRVVDSHRAGLIAAAVFATSPFIYQFAQEARPYSLLTLSAGISLLVFAVGVRGYILQNRAPAVVGTAWRIGRKSHDLLWLALFVSLLCAITTHHTALTLLPVIGGPWLLLVMRNRHRRVHLFNTFIFLAALFAVYCLVFLPGFMESWSNFRQDGVSFRYGVLIMFIVYGNGRVLAASVLFAIPVLFALWKWRSGCDLAWVLVFLSACVGMLAIVLFIGQVHGSVFKVRTLIWVTVPYFVLLSVGLCGMRSWLSSTLLTAIVLANVIGIVMVTESVKQPWERVAHEVHQVVKDGDGILVCPAYNHKAMFRYWDGPTADLWGYNSRSDQAVYPMPDLHSNLEAHRRQPNGMVLTFPEFVDVYNRVWLVGSWHPECRSLGEPVFDVSFDRHVWLTNRLAVQEGNLVIRKIEQAGAN